jgi:hypothetical protein
MDAGTSLPDRRAPWWALFLLRFYPYPGPKVFVIKAKRHLYSIIAPFVTPEHPRDFFRQLESTQGIVFGSVARYLLLLNQLRLSLPKPFELRIAVGNGMNEELFTFSMGMGCTSSEEASEEKWDGQMRMLEVFRRQLPDGTVSTQSMYSQILLH